MGQHRLVSIGEQEPLGRNPAFGKNLGEHRRTASDLGAQGGWYLRQKT
jgi:hypothetical protein